VEEDNKVDHIIRLDQTAAERECIVATPQITAAFLSEIPRIRCPVLYVFGGKGSYVYESMRSDLMARTGTGLGGSGGSKIGRVENKVLEESGHVIPFEEVGREKLAVVTSAWLGQWYNNYLEEERITSELGTGHADESGRRVSEEYMQALQGMSTDPRTIPRPKREKSGRPENKL
jgi:hypothetical protein